MGNSPVPVNSPHKGQWRGALMFSLICVWINGWENNRDASDLRRHRSPYDVIVMIEINHNELKTAATANFYHSSFLLANPIGCAQRIDWVIQNVSQRCLCKYSCQQDPFVKFISGDITIWLVKLVRNKKQYHCFVIELKIMNKGTCYRFG